jgi:hypothetical protein
MQSMFRDNCWVCGVRFTDATPPGPANKERHHIIPRAAGGADGPTVDICDKHHTILHKIALRLSSGKPHFDLVTGEDAERRKKLYWLATRVFNAFQATANDPNKQAAVFISVDHKQRAMVAALMKIYPNLKSREDVYSFALETLFARHFSR